MTPPNQGPISSPTAGSGTPEERLAALGLALPTPPTPVASYVPSVLAGDLLYVSGQVPVREGKPLYAGRVGEEVSIEQAIECARACALNGLAVAKGVLGDLARVKRVVRIGCFVACGAEFTQHPKVANGASDLLVEVFGEAGRHARAAVGAPSLPLGVPVEVEFLFQVEEGGTRD